MDKQRIADMLEQRREAFYVQKRIESDLVELILKNPPLCFAIDCGLLRCTFPTSTWEKKQIRQIATENR